MVVKVWPKFLIMSRAVKKILLSQSVTEVNPKFENAAKIADFNECFKCKEKFPKTAPGQGLCPDCIMFMRWNKVLGVYGDV